MKKQEAVTEKKCTCCGETKPIGEFRTRPFGFTLNQCKKCEGAMNKARRLAKKAAVETNPIVTITTKSGKVVEAYTKPIAGCKKATSPNTDKVLYFGSDVTRDTARVAFSTYANVVRTGITYQPVEN
jgi:hypothetical protein